MLKNNGWVLLSEADAEKITKAVDGVEYEASDFLVVEDPEKSDTWHLQIKRNGEVDHELMGNAHAALVSPKGFRGEKYDGPQKSDALEKLKALYKSEEMEWPGDTAEESRKFVRRAHAHLAEMYGDAMYAPMPYIPWAAKTFSDLEAAQKADETTNKIHELSYQFQSLVRNVTDDREVEDKKAALGSLIDEFKERVMTLLDDIGAEPTQTAPTAPAESKRKFNERAGHVVKLAEGDTPVTNPRAPLVIEAAIIKPGFGNERDNNYYPREMLEKYARQFEGAKMYTTDHKDAEKNERTEVSRIDKITGFTEAGEPIARVVIFDPDFAEKTRNRHTAGQIESLECSILAMGKSHPGTMENKKCNIVDEIGEVLSVDWVTKAGAGGRAIGLAESGQGDDKAPPVSEGGVPAPAPTLISESLDQDTVRNILAETRLPNAAREKLRGGTYTNRAALDTAISAEVAYLKSATGSGRPVSFDPPPAPATTVAETNKTKNAINTKFLGR